MTSKQRAYLRSLAHNLDAIFQVGKGGIGENMLKQVSDALEARELIKLRVLENSDYSAREAADIISEEIGAHVIQVIGTKFVLYRESQDKKKIVLPL